MLREVAVCNMLKRMPEMIHQAILRNREATAHLHISKSVSREKSGNRVAWGDGDAA